MKWLCTVLAMLVPYVLFLENSSKDSQSVSMQTELQWYIIQRAEGLNYSDESWPDIQVAFQKVFSMVNAGRSCRVQPFTAWTCSAEVMLTERHAQCKPTPAESGSPSALFASGRYSEGRRSFVIRNSSHNSGQHIGTAVQSRGSVACCLEHHDEAC